MHLGRLGGGYGLARRAVCHHAGSHSFLLRAGIVSAVGFSQVDEEVEVIGNLGDPPLGRVAACCDRSGYCGRNKLRPSRGRVAACCDRGEGIGCGRNELRPSPESAVVAAQLLGSAIAHR